MKAIKEFIRLNKKMFYVFCAVIGTFILLLIILVVVKLVKGTKISYDKLQDRMVTAAENYYDDNPKTLPKNEGEEISVSIDTLVDEGYLSSLERLVDATCRGNVMVKKNGDQYMYYPSLDCGSEYKTRSLGSIITDQSNVVESGDGLYKYNDGYVFRGEYVNNYVSFADSVWRIISIDNAGNIRMINEKEENTYNTWDDRYNIHENRSVGINNYDLSRIKKSLEEIYDEYDKEEKRHIIKQNVCVQGKSESDSSINTHFSCSSVVSNQYVGVISISDFALASIDSNCTSIYSDSCSNYNYLYPFISNMWTSTPYSGNSYQAYYVDSYVDVSNAENMKRIYQVISISGKEIYKSGAGTLDNPYKL
ncbi:MAG: hypothetical protein IJ134_03940 [Bacilli bacterium]|nr:hypothetical protein [Bacilli bacterium]